MIAVDSNTEIQQLIAVFSSIILAPLCTDYVVVDGSSIFFLSETKDLAFGYNVEQNSALINPMDEATVWTAIHNTLLNYRNDVVKAFEYAASAINLNLPLYSGSEVSFFE